MRAKCGSSGDLLAGLPFVSLPLCVCRPKRVSPTLTERWALLEADKSTQAHCVSQIR